MNKVNRYIVGLMVRNLVYDAVMVASLFYDLKPNEAAELVLGLCKGTPSTTRMARAYLEVENES
jgi:hypothetical protein